jgi:hypothetical protein
MSYETNTEVAAKKQVANRDQPITIIATVEQPRCHKDSGWQAVGIRPVKTEGGVEISSIIGVTALTLSRYMRVKVRGSIESRFGKYQVAFTECEEV